MATPIENVSSGPARILIGFNAGIYETIDLSQSIAANPKDVLATNFVQPTEVFAKFPDRDVFNAGKDRSQQEKAAKRALKCRPSRCNWVRVAPI